MTSLRFFFFLSTLLVARLASGGTSPAVAADCKRRVLHAHGLLEQIQQHQNGRVAVVRFLSETVHRVPGQQQPAKTVSRFVMMSKNNHTYLSNGEMTVYQDQQTQVCVVQAQRVVLITEVPTGTAGALAPWAQLRDQIVKQAHVTNCVVVSTKKGLQRRITIVPVAPSAMAGKITRIEYWLDGRTDALQKMTMHYPAGGQITSAGLVLEGQSWKDRDPAVDLPPVRQVLGPDNKRLPAYQAYQLQDQRNG